MMLLMALSPYDPHQWSPNLLSQQHSLGDFLKPKPPQALPTSCDSESHRNRLKTPAVPWNHPERSLNTISSTLRYDQSKDSARASGFLRCPGDSNVQQGDNHPCPLANAPDQCHTGEGPRPAEYTSPRAPPGPADSEGPRGH